MSDEPLCRGCGGDGAPGGCRECGEHDHGAERITQLEERCAYLERERDEAVAERDAVKAATQEKTRKAGVLVSALMAEVKLCQAENARLQATVEAALKAGRTT